MSLRLALTLSLALSSTLAGLANAANAGNQDADADARVSAPNSQTKQYIYDDEDIDGESLRPDHERVDFRPPGKHPSLIQVRAHFIPQLLRMATDV